MTDSQTPVAGTDKPFYRKPWFIVVAVLIAIVAIGSSGDDTEDSNLASEEPTSSTTSTTGTDSATTTSIGTTTTTTTSTTTTTTAPTTTTTTLPAWDTFTVEGSGDDVIDFVVPNDDPAVLELTHRGSSNFSVVSYTAAGERLDLLVNEIGLYSGARPVNFLTGEEVGELEITANGAWAITVRPLFASPTLESTFSGTGSEVLLYLANESRLSLTHNGSSNFVVRAWSASERDLLVNEIGAYEGTVRIDPSALVIEVEADGDWTMEAG